MKTSGEMNVGKSTCISFHSPKKVPLFFLESAECLVRMCGMFGANMRNVR
jgi:hypothetical protein